MGTKRHPGKYDCLAKVHPDEPIFILRAQDTEAADLVELWAIRAKAAGCHNDKTREAMDTAEEMRAWPKQKKPD